jgi:hypothetical protein
MSLPALLRLACIAVLCIILTLGLWPFHAPENDVGWPGNRRGLHFGRYSTVFSTAALPAPSALNESAGGSVEIWLECARKWGSGTLLSFYRPKHPPYLSLRQSLTDVLLQAGPTRLYGEDVFRKTGPVFLTVTSGNRGTTIYIDGVPVRSVPQLRIPAGDFAGRLVVGDSPGQTDSWRGQLFGLALYDRELPAAQVSKHYTTWTQSGRPEMAAADGNVALYLFDECSGNLVHSRMAPGPDLYIPDRYLVVDQIFLEPFWEEFSLSRSYASAALKNIVGFVPLGFCFCAYFLALHMRRARLATVILGLAVSLTIEVLQGWLPTRDSGTTDLFTNTLGTWLGVFLYQRLAGILRSLTRTVP